MIIAISTDQDYVSGHFGRCPSFTLVDVQDGKVLNQEIVQNPGHMPGAIPQFLKEKDAECIIAGGMGARAEGLFQQFGIKTIVGVQGKIDEVISKLLDGTLEPGESLCKPGGGKGYGLDKTECDHAHEEQNACPHEIKKGVKVCVTAEGASLDYQVDPRFGRCQYFIFIDTETLEFEVVANQNISGMGGVGIQSGQLVAEKGAKVVLTGKVGPNASQTLEAAGIEVVLDVCGSVKEAVGKYKNGDLQPSKGPNAQEKSGMDKAETA